MAVDPLDPNANLPDIVAKLNELIGAFNERQSAEEQRLQAALESLPTGIRNRVNQALATS